MTIELFDAKLTVVSCDHPLCDATTQSWASQGSPWMSSAAEDGWTSARLYPAIGERVGLHLCPEHAHLKETITMVGAVMERLDQKESHDIRVPREHRGR